MLLIDLKKGQKAVIQKIEQGSSSLKLMELGFREGAHIQIESISFTGDPIAFRLNNSLVAVRKSETLLIHVNLVD